MRSALFSERTKCFLLLSTLVPFYVQSENQPPVLSLEKAITLAQENDPWLHKSHLLEEKSLVLSQSADQLEDPVLNAGMLNLPSNGFDFAQEPMTQLKIGITQMLPRGNTLKLAKQKLELTASQQHYMRLERKLNLVLKTTQLWLDAYEKQASLRLIDEARPLFEKLNDIVNASYSSLSGGADQQAIVGAELALMRLQDRADTLNAQQAMSLAKLQEFLAMQGAEQGSKLSFKEAQYTLPAKLSSLHDASHHQAQLNLASNLSERLIEVLSEHPRLQIFDQYIAVSQVDEDIAKQGYKPQWGVNASYAYRDDAPNGDSRADFLSVGVQMSLPLFSSQKQEDQVSASVLNTESIRTDKRLQLRALLTGLQAAHKDYAGIQKRKTNFDKRIIPHLSLQSELALNAYTNDQGNFYSVVTSKIEELDTKIERIKIEVAEQNALAQINYYLAGESYEQ